ncbi:MAG: hypothetical protein ABSF26_14410 [Thermoguttaceae bacterium]|jgi:hypothetical protein
MSMTALGPLHRRLSRLKRRRVGYRWLTAYSALATAVLLVLAVAFPIDWYFQRSMDVWQRLFLLVLGAGVVIWAFRRYTRPWLGGRESELDLALMVQSREHIDTDLVAALEFEWPEAPTWGSVALEEAVISQAATQERHINVMKNLPARELARRIQVLGLVVVLWAVVAVFIPQHIVAFLQRLLLGSAHYPTQTQIDMLLVNGREIEPAQWGAQPIHLRHGQPLRLEARCSRELPGSGVASLSGKGSGLRADLALAAVEGQSGAYAGVLPRLIDSVRCQFFVGDAWTDPADLIASPPPAVELEPEVIPPDYTRHEGAAATKVPRGMRQFAVLEGSQVRMTIRSDKRLKEAILTLDEKPYRMVRHEPSDRLPEVWVLTDDEETPLTCVLRPLRFSLQVTDTDEQQLERPLEGVVRIQPDLPPRVAAATRTPFVLPVARPTIYFRAIDDHALARVWFAYEILHAGETPREDGSAPEGRTGEVNVYQLADGQTPQRDLEDVRPLDLAPLKLVKGDTVRVTVWAKDYRGRTAGPKPVEREGKSTSSEPMVFQVTDEQGILASMLEADRHSARELKTMIQRELGIGESR